MAFVLTLLTVVVIIGIMSPLRFILNEYIVLKVSVGRQVLANVVMLALVVIALGLCKFAPANFFTGALSFAMFVMFITSSAFLVLSLAAHSKSELESGFRTPPGE
jgi:hypothetical protein